MKKKQKHKKRRTPKSKKQAFSIQQLLSSWWGEKHPVLLFMLKFVGLYVVFYALITLTYFKEHIHPLITGTNAKISSFLLNLMGENTIVSNTDNISSAAFSISIEQGCDAIEPIALFLAAVLAYPAAWHKKLFGVLLATPTLFVLNLIRIVSLFIIGVYWTSIFDLMHVEVWQFLFILLTIVLCFVWIQWATKPAKVKLDART